MKYAYPCSLEPDEPPGFLVVTFPDIPEAATGGESLGDALENGLEALELVLACRLEEAREIPEPSPLQEGQELVVLTPAFAAKMALLQAMEREDVSREELQRRLGASWQQTRDLLDPHRRSPMGTLTQALQTVGRRLVVEDIPPDGGEHLTEPAGPRSMEDVELIRRFRQYCLHRDLEWVIRMPEGREALIETGDASVELPEGEIPRERVREMLDRLGVNQEEF